MYSEDDILNREGKKDINPEEEAGKAKFRISVIISSSFLVLIWLIKIFEEFTKLDLSVLGVFPNKISGLIGILTAPLIHADFSHLASNSITLFVLMIFLFYAYINSSVKVFLFVYFFSNVLVWFFGRPAYHIGASGLIYGILAFLFFVGLFRRDPASIGLSLLVTFMYGGLIWGIFPTDPKISFEAHISGAIIGVLCAVIFRNSDPKPPKYDWEEEEDEEESENEDELNLK
ncbi:MAG: rhomboid family intramembrane serine protease [Ignavibacteria bacterium]|nr:rhomboid family intramembrane serine protease [Ignavibacteria bacterium]